MPRPVILSQTGAGVSPWKNADTHIGPFNLGINCTVTGTVAFSIEVTNSNLESGATAVIQPTTVAAATASVVLNLVTPCRYWRLNIASGSGTVSVEAIQSGL